MPTPFSPRKILAAALLGAAFSPTAVHAQYSWSADFNNQLTPAGMTLRGNAVIPINGGVSNTPCLALTPSARGMQGDVILPRIWGDDEAPADVTLRFSLKFAGNNNGVLGDGFSVSIVNGIPGVLVDEEGFGDGPSYEFDTFENNDGPAEGGLGVRWPETGFMRKTWSGAPNRLAALFPDRNSWYSVDLRSMLYSKQQVIRVNGDTQVPLTNVWNSVPVIHPDGHIVLAARTGNAFNGHFIDNLSVDVTPYPIFREQPQSQQVTSGTSVMFQAQTNFNTLPWRGIGTYTLVSGATSSWQIRHPGGQWTAVPDKTNSLLWGPDARPFVVFTNLREDRGLWEGDDPAWSITGTEVRCVLTWLNGYTTTTQTATLRVMPLPEEIPGAITLWNSYPQGSASVTFPHEEGKVLRLTPAQPDCAGGFVFDELANNNAGEPRVVDSFIASFQFRGSLSSELRADGFSFNLATDLPGTLPAGAGEEGAGTGLTISFDAYANGPEDPAAIDVLWKGQRIARLPRDPDVLFNGDWTNCYVRINYGGTLDLAINGVTVLGGAPLPGWTGIPTARMAFYGRTGSYWQQQDVRELSVWFTASSYTVFEPELSLQVTGPDSIMLQWNVSPTDAWDLYESANLVTWTKTTTAPVVIGSWRQLYLDALPARRFYRMQKQGFTSP